MYNQQPRRKPRQQSWEVGSIVQVGFLRLRVITAGIGGDYTDNAYELESLDGSRVYKFEPHYGLTRLNY